MRDERAYVFVTGGTGFIGAHLLRQLTRDAHEKPWSEVRALVRNEARAEQARALGAVPVVGDLLDEQGSWREVAAGARYVVHSAQPPLSDYGARERMDEQLIDALDKARGARVVFVCGSSYFGTAPPGGLIDETTLSRPIGLGPSFVSGLQKLRAAGLDHVAAFVGGVYGLGSWFVAMYLRALERDEPILLCDPTPVWPYVHIDDCARAIEHLMTVDAQTLDAIGRDVIVVDDEPVPMDTFVSLLGAAVGREPKLSRLGREALRKRLDAGQFAYFSANMPHQNQRLRRLGFSCRYPHIREGIAALDLGARFNPAR